jgi:hypothetical protein
VVEHGEIGIDVQREAVTRPSARNPHADRRNLLVADPHAGKALGAFCGDPEVGKGRDQDVFQCAYIRDDITLPRAPLSERHDRVAHELAGAVIRDVAAPIRLDEIGTDRSGVAQHVLQLRARPQRVDVRMLEQQQVVVVGVAVQRALQRLGFAIRNRAQPARAQQ